MAPRKIEIKPEELLKPLSRHKIEAYKTKVQGPLEAFYFREAFTHMNIWGMPCEEAIKALTLKLRGKQVLEVMAGCGYLAHLLSQAGVNIVATDECPDQAWKRPSHKKQVLHNFSFVEPLGALEALKKYDGSDTVIMSWPPYDQPDAYKVATNLKKGQTLIYVGEGAGGCTGDDQFHECLREKFIELEWEIPWFKFPHIHDSLRVYKKS